MWTCLSLIPTLFPLLLIGQLGHRQFARRDLAQRTLARMGEAARPALTASASHPCPETRRRVELLQRPAWVYQMAEDKTKRLGKLPWIHEYAVGDDAYMRYLIWPEGSPHGPPDWPEYRQATRRWCVAQWLAKRPRREILADLAVMWNEERAWKAANPPRPKE